MIKWLLLFLGLGILLAFGVVLAFGLMLWNHERGFPKSILNDQARGICVVSKQPFVLLKTDRAGLRKDMANLLPIPEGVGHYYRDYTPGVFLTEDGEELADLTGAIEIPAGTRFILRDGFQRRTLNENGFYYWLEPQGMSLDSSYFHYSGGLSHTDEEMSLFPDTLSFDKDCPPEG
ncbi:MAG: hypothetical protein ABJG15_16040 [Hyphomonadaceae bacterium]